MMWQIPFERRQRRRRRIVVLALFLVGLVIAHYVDESVAAHFLGGAAKDDSWERNDWVQFFRAVGFLPTWLFIAASFVLVDLTRNTKEDFWATCRRGVPLALSAALAGLAAEVLKVVVSRERPFAPSGSSAEEVARLGEHVWHIPLSGMWTDYESGLGMPSSHAAVAFGGAIMLVRLCPRGGWVAVLAAVGCAYTRVASGAHFISDVYVAAFVACAVSSWVASALPPRRVRDELERIEAARSR